MVIMNNINTQDAKRVFELLASIFFHGNFIAETPNEKELQKILERNGYFFTDEDELLEKLYGPN
jgi:hypothetical protein